MSAFLIAFFLIFVAELGDKSQLVALWLSTRHRWWIVLLGVLCATLVVHLGSVVIGRTIDQLVPEKVLFAGIGLSFLFFAAWSLRGDKLDDDEAAATLRTQRSLIGSFGFVTLAFFGSELGDKTQLATITLAGERPQLLAIWLGSTFGMVSADALAIGVGILAGKRLPQKAIAMASAGLFCVFGALALLKAFS